MEHLSGHWLTRTGSREEGADGRTAKERSREDALACWLGEERMANVFSEFRPMHDNMRAMVDAVVKHVKEQDIQLIDSLKAEWKTLVSDVVGELCEPSVIQGECLIVEVYNSACLYMLEQQQKSFVTERVKAFSGGRVTSVKFRVTGRHRIMGGRESIKKS